MCKSETTRCSNTIGKHGDTFSSGWATRKRLETTTTGEQKTKSDFQNNTATVPYYFRRVVSSRWWTSKYTTLSTTAYRYPVVLEVPVVLRWCQWGIDRLLVSSSILDLPCRLWHLCRRSVRADQVCPEKKKNLKKKNLESERCTLTVYKSRGSWKYQIHDFMYY